MSEEKRLPEQVSVNTAMASFVRNFLPTENEKEADEYFTIGRLRDEFCAWPLFGSNADDPLIAYMNALAANGFHPTRTVSSGPCILCKRRPH